MIREHRKKVGLTQGQLAQRLGFHVQFISNIERGKCNLPVAYFKQVSRLLNIPLSKMIDHEVRRTEVKVKKALGVK